MAVAIDELQVETQAPPAPAGSGPGAGGKPPAKLDLKVEMERLWEREIRLRAD